MKSSPRSEIVTIRRKLVGYADANGVIRCLRCARIHPEENWSNEDYFFAEEVIRDRMDKYKTECGLCGADLYDAAVEANP